MLRQVRASSFCPHPPTVELPLSWVGEEEGEGENASGLESYRLSFFLPSFNRFSFLYFWLFFSLQNWAEKRRQWTFILWNRPSIANFSLGHLFMIKLKTFEIRSLSWKCWQILTQRRAIGQHNNMKKALPQAQLPFSTGTELCYGRH